MSSKCYRKCGCFNSCTNLQTSQILIFYVIVVYSGGLNFPNGFDYIIVMNNEKSLLNSPRCYLGHKGEGDNRYNEDVAKLYTQRSGPICPLLCVGEY